MNLRKYRKQASLTQKRLAELCDTDPRYIGQLETGHCCPFLCLVYGDTVGHDDLC
ncbi:MAG: helix-turn-helix domain-containing protein [Treponema sp.]|nr:helix-turn-helix domain-containing protein [Treponema sp.]